MSEAKKLIEELTEASEDQMYGEMIKLYQSGKPEGEKKAKELAMKLKDSKLPKEKMKDVDHILGKK